MGFPGDRSQLAQADSGCFRPFPVVSCRFRDPRVSRWSGKHWRTGGAGEEYVEQQQTPQRTTKSNVAIVGYGNIGRYAVHTLAEAPDLTLVGVVRRDPTDRSDVPADIPVVGGIEELPDVEVALLCGPTRSIPEIATACLAGYQYRRFVRHSRRIGGSSEPLGRGGEGARSCGHCLGGVGSGDGLHRAGGF